MTTITKNRHQASLEYAILALFNKEYIRYIKSIYLFGSCARGEQKYDSDVDIFVFLDENTPNSIKLNLCNIVISDDLSLPEVDIHSSRTEEFSFCKTFNDNLEREGVLLWERS